MLRGSRDPECAFRERPTDSVELPGWMEDLKDGDMK